MRHITYDCGTNSLVYIDTNFDQVIVKYLNLEEITSLNFHVPLFFTITFENGILNKDYYCCMYIYPRKLVYGSNVITGDFDKPIELFKRFVEIERMKW